MATSRSQCVRLLYARAPRRRQATFLPSLYRNIHSSSVVYAAQSRNIRDLPDKVHLWTGPIGRLSKVLPPRKSNAITTRVGSSFAGHHSLQWCEEPRNVLIVKKRNDTGASKALQEIIAYIRRHYPHMNVIVEQEEDVKVNSNVSTTDDSVVSTSAEEKHLLASKVDLVITLGGDGTILHVSSLFDQSEVPPVLSFSMGTLGFLLPFHIDSFRSAFTDLLASQSTLLLRMRLHQTLHNADGSLLLPRRDGERNEVHLMNEVALHRAISPHMTTIDAFVDGRLLTRAISDGLIIATPTGSTAYSLSAGGPIVHPSVQSLLLTPICPRSLSFRPVLLPSDANIQLKVSNRSRAAAQLSVDGREMRSLEPGQFLQVAMSPFPIPCVNRRSSSEEAAKKEASPLLAGKASLISANDDDSPSLKAALPSHSDRLEDDWVGDINTLLRFNASFSGRGLLSGNGSDEEVDEEVGSKR